MSSMDERAAIAQKAEERHAKKTAKKMQEAAAKEAAEDAANAAKAAAKANEPKRGVHTLISTREKNAKNKERKLAMQANAAGDVEVEQQIEVYREDGKKIHYSTAAENIQIFLQKHGSEANLEEVRKGVGIDLLQPTGLLAALRVNPRIEAIGLATGELLKYRPPFGVRNRAALSHMLSRAMPGGGGGETEAVLRSDLKAEETYDGVDADIDELLAQGRCVRIPVNDPNKRELSTVLFAMPAGRPVTQEVRELWVSATRRMPSHAALCVWPPSLLSRVLHRPCASPSLPLSLSRLSLPLPLSLPPSLSLPLSPSLSLSLSPSSLSSLSLFLSSPSLSAHRPRASRALPLSPQKAERVPAGPALQDELKKRRLRTEEELNARAERKAELQRKAKEAKEAEKKNRRTGRVNQVSSANAHLSEEQKARLFANH